MSVMSEEGTVYGDDVSSLCGDWGPDGGDSTRDLLSRPPEPPPQPTSRLPPPHAEVQLRYLLQVLLEAGCLEWSVVVAVLLRDALAVLSVITLARAPDVPAQVINRLTAGLQDLLFTNTECLGYQNFLGAIVSQIKVLERLASTREVSRTPSPPSSRPPSTSRESEPSSNTEACVRSAIQTTPPVSTQQQAAPQHSLKQQQQNQQPVQLSQQIPQQQMQPPTLTRMSVLPRPTSGTAETLAKETLSQASQEELLVQEESLMAVEEGGSAACVVS